MLASALHGCFVVIYLFIFLFGPSSMGAGLLLFHGDIITLATEIGIFVIQEK